MGIRFSGLGLIMGIVSKVLNPQPGGKKMLLDHDDFELLCHEVIKTKLKLGKSLTSSDFESIENAVESLSFANEAHFEKVFTEIKYYDEFYSTLAALQQ